MKKIIFTALAASLILFSCNDFLDKEPLDGVPTNKYLLNEADLGAYTLGLYGNFSSHGGYGIGTFANDNGTDNQAGSNPNSNFVIGETRVGQSGGAWNFGSIRTCNYFLSTVLPRWEKGELSGNTDNIDHYIGEMYFMRALIYFGKLKEVGDFPIIKRMVNDDYEDVREVSKRRPRNEVARFIINDLDSAYLLMKNVAPQTNRLNKNVAALLKSRVALYEGTWLKYHKGTGRVPGGTGWPGANKDYLKDFTIDIDSEINYFLTEAMNSAKIVADNVNLGDYSGMFNNKSLSGYPEVLLWKAYDSNLIPAVNHFVVGYLQRNGGGNSGYTRSLVESYLMSNGLPIYATGSGYQGDKTYEAVGTDRDSRLIESMMLPGDLLTTKPSFTINGGYFFRGSIVEANENRCPTGYAIKKGLNTDPEQGPTLPSVTACVIYRAAEAYLNYIEADFEKNGRLDASSEKYWKALRARASVDTDYNKTIQATDLSKESDLAKYSGSSLVSPTLYNIRRERRSEFIAEGMRKDDLYRWRALDMMKNYIVEGFNLWDNIYELYDVKTENIDKVQLIESGANGANVSARSDSKYIRPYRVSLSNIAYNGYTFNQNHYLSPIAYDHFRLTTEVDGSGDVSTSTIYQNAGWKIEVGSTADTSN